MESIFKTFEISKSSERIQSILDKTDNGYEELKSIPKREDLTYKNGYNVDCTAMFIDIRDSSKLPDKHTKPVLAKIYRSFVSEVVALLNSSDQCKEINIEGDCVWAVFNTPYKENIDSVFSTSAQILSLVKILNYKFKKKQYSEIKIGIGIDYGNTLMVKSGYSGSGLNQVIWMGKVINGASKLCGKANKNFIQPLVCSKDFFDNLNDENKKLLSYNYNNLFYEGDIINTAMDYWYKINCT